MFGEESSGTSSSSELIRSRISREALFVNVTASTADGGTCRCVMMYAMRCVMTRVFPLPAPARMSRGPSVWVTASRCCALRPFRKSMKRETRLILTRGVLKAACYLPPGLILLLKTKDNIGPAREARSVVEALFLRAHGRQQPERARELGAGRCSDALAQLDHVSHEIAGLGVPFLLETEKRQIVFSDCKL